MRHAVKNRGGDEATWGPGACVSLVTLVTLIYLTFPFGFASRVCTNNNPSIPLGGGREPRKCCSRVLPATTINLGLRGKETCHGGLKRRMEWGFEGGARRLLRTVLSQFRRCL